MNYLDPVKNFCQVEVQGGNDDSSTSILLYTGQGAKLPNPAIDGAFNLVWWNVTDHPNPADDLKKEIVRVTAITGDTLTVSRGQEDTTAQTHNKTGKRYFLALVLTAKTIQDIDEKISSLTVLQKRVMIVPTGAINGSNKVFQTLENYSNLQVYVNGLAQSSADFALTSTNSFTMTVAPDPGEVIYVSYDMV
jgi:hypothetical protein